MKNSKLKLFEDLVELRYFLYNSLFLTLPFSTLSQYGKELPLFAERCKQRLENKEDPFKVIEDFFSQTLEIRDEELPPPPPPKEKRKLIWSGEVTPQKWMNLYTKVLTKFVKDGEIKLNVTIEATPVDGVTDQHVEDTKAALRELGLDDDIKVS